jgi:hypothetical protein
VPNKFLLYTLIAVLFPVQTPFAKSLHELKGTAAFREARGHHCTQSVQALQQRLRPFFERRCHGRPNGMVEETAPPTQGDLFALAGMWKALSPEFQALYLKSLEIPQDMVMHLSPGFGIEIYYATSGSNAVDPADEYGFEGNNWQNKTGGANAVPDYIDEVAWAMDSAWAMEIERFGFPQPIGYKDPRHMSDRYKIVIQNPGEGFYGMTYFSPQQSGSGIGFASHIEIRHNWIGWNSGGFDYETHPEKAVRVTCVHEFQHAIQYAMVHNVVDDVWLDDFPVSWVEATAVLMEELGFDYVNDYLQYNTYFYNPRLSMLDKVYDGLSEYKNSILAMYLYRHAGEAGDIGFIKQVFTANEEKRVPFHDNLQKVSNSFGYNWVNLLNAFHTGSFFTGNRADTAVFISDAAILDMWTYGPDDFDSCGTVQKEVLPYAMNTFVLVRNSSHGDTIGLAIEGAMPAGSGLWDASCVLLENAGGKGEPPVPAVFSSPGQGIVYIDGWNGYEEAMLVVTNGDPDRARTAAVNLICHAEVPKTATLIAAPNPSRISVNGKIRFEVTNLKRLAIFSQSGSLITSVSTSRPSRQLSDNGDCVTFTWPLTNGAGRKIAPGTYYAVIRYADPEGSAMKDGTIKLMVLP